MAPHVVVLTPISTKGMLRSICLTFLLGSLAAQNSLMAGDPSRKDSEPILDTAGDRQPEIWGVATNGLRPVVFIGHSPAGWDLTIGLLPLEQFPVHTWLAITNQVRSKVELWGTNGVQVLSTNPDVVNAFRLPKRTAVSEVLMNSGYPRHMRVLQWWEYGDSPRSVGRPAPYGSGGWRPESAFNMSPTNDYVLKISPLIYKADTNRVAAQLVEFRPIVIKLMPRGRFERIEE
jgi:hypothetical protein